MKLIEFILVERYFREKLKKVKISSARFFYPSEIGYQQGSLISKKIFKSIAIPIDRKNVKYLKWVRQSPGWCYWHASSILLGLNPNDKCVTGRLDYHRNERFYHAWNEFMYNGKWYVYDCQHDCVFDKEHFYSYTEPTVMESYTLEEILAKYGKFKIAGKKFDTIEVPGAPDEVRYKRNINPETGNTQAKDCCYERAKITLKKSGEVKKAVVVAIGQEY